MRTGTPMESALPTSTPASRAQRKVGLILLGVTGIAICIAVLAASLAPSPGQSYRPIGGVLGSLGLLVSVWFIWVAYRTVISESKARIRLRQKARRIVRKNPQLATELGIGRPDKFRDFDDGGLIDVNHVPAAYLLHLPGINQALASRIAAIRQSIGGFDTSGDMEAGSLDEAQNLMLFRPLLSSDSDELGIRRARWWPAGG